MSDALREAAIYLLRLIEECERGGVVHVAYIRGALDRVRDALDKEAVACPPT